VTRSVTNHINDISKIDPALAIETLARWRDSGKQDKKEMDYIIRHGLRTLIKRGDPRAIQMLGLSHEPSVRITNLVVPKHVRMNTALEFSFSIEAREDTNVIIDYTLHFQNKAGRLSSKKIFKLAKLSLKKGIFIPISKRHMFRQNMTTRTLYPGTHTLEIQINGKIYACRKFELK
jgi:hypothetical protein